MEQVVDTPQLTSFSYCAEDSTEELWEFPLRSAPRLKELKWLGDGLTVPLQALAACKMLTAIDLRYDGNLTHSDIQDWPRIPELTRLDLDAYIPEGPYIMQPFTKFTKYVLPPCPP